ncbi:MAG: YjbH domain-containing protein [Bacteroidetes bacterium]|nr:YjbH domain-containing protein [Bacteroidota bacterium]
MIDFLRFNTGLARVMLLSVFLFSGFWAQSQRNLSGKPGYFNVPSAAPLADGLLSFGYNYNPQKYSLRYPGKLSEQILYVNLGLLPNVDVTFSLLQARENGKKIKDGLGDRQFDIRWRLFNEKKYQPSVALVMTNPFTIDAAMITQAVVATKHFELLPWLQTETTMGYGSNYYFYRAEENRNNGNIFTKFTLQKKTADKFKNSYLVGPIAGGKISFKNIGGLMGEWDGLKWNAGAYLNIIDHLHVQAGILNGDQWMFGASFQGNLNPKNRD